MTNPIRFFKRRGRMDLANSRANSPEILVDLDHGFEELVASMSAEELAAVDLDDLREFMEESEEVPMADPVFKERLRKELWWMMVSRLVPSGEKPPSS
ncbi:hypothetical protein MK280_02755 [Myxococcota bacterium]|nr:hypothetical protein [Myxococcota bacterium]